MECIVSEAKKFAARGQSLRVMSSDLGVSYGTLKEVLAEAGHKHPTGLSLIENRILHESGFSLKDVLSHYISNNKSRNDASIELQIDNKTLQKAADIYGLDWPRKKPRPKYVGNIVKATRERQSKRKDLHWLTYNGQKKYLSQWALEYDLSPSTLRRRLLLGYSMEEALLMPIRGRRGFTGLNSLARKANY